MSPLDSLFSKTSVCCFASAIAAGLHCDGGHEIPRGTGKLGRSCLRSESGRSGFVVPWRGCEGLVGDIDADVDVELEFEVEVEIELPEDGVTQLCTAPTTHAVTAPVHCVSR